MIEISHLQKEYSDSMPLKDVNTTIHKGDVIAVIGASGCGKSTLLRCINMLDPPTGGKIVVDGEDITGEGYDLTRLRRKIGMVFQSYELFNHQSVIENVMRPQMQLLGRGKQEAYDKAYALLSMVGLANRQFQFPEQLSGGQKQRIAIARALAMDPEILLLDEPTSALDPAMVGEVEAVIQELAKRGVTMMLVTHNMNFARSVSNRVFYLDGGCICEDGTPKQIFEEPQKERTKRFIRSLSMLEIKADAENFDYPRAIADIERFGARQGLDRRTVHKLQMIFEELCALYFQSDEYGGNCISAVFEHQERNRVIEVTFRHNSEETAADDIQSEISLAILRGFTETFEHSCVQDEDAYTHKITLVIREGESHGQKN